MTAMHDDLLKALHLKTRDGKINQDAHRKIKQIEHLYQFIKPLLSTEKNNTIVDVGAGKAYIGHYLSQKADVSIYNIETRKDIVENSQELCKKMSIKNFYFIQKNACDAHLDPQLPPHIDLVMGLHACDTATDDAIQLALKLKAQNIVLIPCCQAEIAALLAKIKIEPLDELWRRPILRREFGSHVTNVLRALWLESKGYQVVVSEFTGLEHSLKNEIIIGKKIQNNNKMAEVKLKSLLETLKLNELHSRYL